MSTRGSSGLLACFLLCLAVPAAKAQFTPVKVKYICLNEGPSWSSSNGGEKHYCWEGKHYSKSTGGVPAFILDYWAEQERESARFSEEMKRNSEEMAARAAASRAAAEERHRAAMERIGARPGVYGRPNSPASAVATVEQSQRPIHEPLPVDLFNGILPGAERATVVAKLGQPHGSITNLGPSGDEESLTYLVERGGSASIRLKQGKLLTIRLPQPD